MSCNEYINTYQRGSQWLYPRFFPEKSARNLCQSLSGEEGKKDLMDPIYLSLIEEVSHILVGTYITSLAKFLKVNLSISIPYTIYDISSSIFNSAVTELSYIADFAFVIDAEFLIKEKKINGNVLTLLDPEALNCLLKRINAMIDQNPLFIEHEPASYESCWKESCWRESIYNSECINHSECINRSNYTQRSTKQTYKEGGSQ